jgi:hypothetical protein
MPHTCKKPKVHHIPHEETISVTSYSASTNGEWIVTHSTLSALAHKILTPSTSSEPTQHDTNNPACGDEEEDPKAKKCYISTACVLYFALLLCFVVVYSFVIV